jgi:hypothetical protein
MPVLRQPGIIRAQEHSAYRTEEGVLIDVGAVDLTLPSGHSTA